jgi:hypothetical protein
MRDGPAHQSEASRRIVCTPLQELTRRLDARVQPCLRHAMPTLVAKRSKAACEHCGMGDSTD